MTRGVVSGPTCRNKKKEMPQLTFQGCTVTTTEDVCYCFSTHPAAVFTPRRLSFIPVFTLGSDGNHINSGVDGFDTRLHNRLHDKVVHSNISCSVFGTQHPGVFLPCVEMTELYSVCPTLNKFTQNTKEV